MYLVSGGGAGGGRKGGCKQGKAGGAQLVSSASAWRPERGEVSTPTTPLWSKFTPISTSFTGSTGGKKSEIKVVDKKGVVGGVTGLAPASSRRRSQLIKTRHPLPAGS